MATVRTLIGYIKGPKGDTGATGATGAQGPAGNDGAPGVTDYATTSAAGLVRVGDDFNINSNNGTLSIKNAFTEASTLANITSGESQATILGKVKKFMTTLMPSNFLINTVNSTATDKALTANMGKTLAGDLATVQTSATASKSYAVGEYLVYNGQLYQVTSAIANGASITGHISATNAGVQIKTLNDSLVKRFIPATITDQLRYGFGWVTSGGARLNIVIPAAVEGRVTNVSVTNFKISMRIPEGGYIIGDAADITSYLDIQTVTIQGFVFVFYKSDGWGVPNNIPVTGGVTMSAVIS